MKTSKGNQFLFFQLFLFDLCEYNFAKLVLCLCFFSIFIEAKSQSSFLLLQNLNSPGPQVTPPGDLFLPPLSRVGGTNTPVCAEWTRTAGPDQSLFLTGHQFSNYSGLDEGKDTRFRVFDGNYIVDAKIQRLDSNKAIITLSNKISKWAMYLIWPENENGSGQAISVNKTEAWWVGPKKAVIGETVSVFGRNLAHKNDTLQSFVYIKPVSGEGQWAKVVKVNPYKVDFIIPSNILSGDYDVWIHNGHGGSFGWSGPLKLTIQESLKWVDSIFNVKDFGAVGNGLNDDLIGIQAAINAASQVSGSSVYFPRGEYLVSNTVYIKSKIIYKGDGPLSVIKCASNFSFASWGLLNSQNAVNFKIIDISFNGNLNYKGNLTNPIYLNKSHNVELSNVSFLFFNYTVLDLNNSSNVNINHCSMVGMQSFLGNCSQLFIDKCDFRLTNDAEMALTSWNAIEVSLTNSTCKDYDNTDPSIGNGWGMGRFFVGNGIFGSNRLTYLANNISIDLTARPRGVDNQNVGEQFMWEGNYTVWTGRYTSSTATTLTLPGLPLTDTNVKFVAIVKGKGLGQSRMIIEYNGTTITLESPWNVAPNEESVINIGTYMDKIVIYNNYLDAKSYAATSLDDNASAGIQPFGGCFNLIADKNTLHELRQGISNWVTRTNPRDKGLQPNFFNLFTNNKMIKCRWGIYNADGNWNKMLTVTEGTGMLGAIYRMNIIEDPISAGIKNSINSSDYPVLDGIVYENNTFNNATIGFESDSTGIANNLFYKNTFNSNSAISPRFNIQATSQLCLRENIFSGTNASYSDGLQKPVIEAPYHVLQIFASIRGSIVDTSFILYNAGTSAMNWSISSNASWLTIPSTTGTILNETAVSNILLRADPKGLTVGTHTAYITITAGTDSKIYSVLFTISINTPFRFFRSKESGKYNDLNTWAFSTDSIAWSNATVLPDSATSAITIQSGHTVTIIDSAVVNHLIVQNEGALNIAPAAFITINDGPGDDITIAPAGRMLIQSDSTGTGSIGNSSGTIGGEVTVERYVTSLQNKSYTLLTPSVNTINTSKPSIRDNLQEGQNNTLINYSNSVSQYGTQITGSKTGENGFDATQTGQPSLFTYDQTLPVPAWVPVFNTDVTNLDAKKGYLIYMRGDRSNNLNKSNTLDASLNTTLRVKGHVLSGDQTFPNQEGNGRFSLVTNPFPSPIYWSNLYNDASTSNAVNFENFYTYWDSYVGMSGGYVTVCANGVTSAPVNLNDKIPSGQAFFIKAKPSIVSPAFTIKEDHKSPINALNAISAAPEKAFMTSLYFPNINGKRMLADAANVVFDKTFSVNVDGNDAREMPNWNENIAIKRDGVLLSIEGRPLISTTDTVALIIQRLKVRSYELQFNPSGFTDTSFQPYLEDKFLNTVTPVSLTYTTIIGFTVSSSASSAAPDRFRVVFQNKQSHFNFVSIKAHEKAPGVSLEWKVQNEMTGDKFKIEKSFDNIIFKPWWTVAAKGNNLKTTYEWLDKNFTAGVNYYRIRAVNKSGNTSYSKTVNVNFEKSLSAFAIYPNPFSGGNFNILFKNVPEGTYVVILTDNNKQTAFTKSIYHSGGSSSQLISVNSNLTSGMYSLQITGNSNTYSLRLFKDGQE